MSDPVDFHCMPNVFRCNDVGISDSQAQINAIKKRLTREGLPAHGGDLDWASKVFGRKKDDWVDVSTGVSPWSWPVPDIPKSVWQSLPASCERLVVAASHYYGCAQHRLTPIPGSQYAISRVPMFVPKGHVALPLVGYQEHRLAWEKHGHCVETYNDMDSLEALVEQGSVEYAVIINPNNPSGERAAVEVIAHIAKNLAAQHPDSLLMVDEAFMDTAPDQSCISLGAANILVLRSIGKFFGLAGLRLGFIVGSSRWCKIFEGEISPWLISHPAIYLGEKALRDEAWITSQKRRVEEGSRILLDLLSSRYESPIATDLFVSVSGRADTLLDDFIGFGVQGVLTRFISSTDNTGLLRFGLPGDRFQTFLERLKLVC
ncbi:MAG: aminotransferase class I/II-fold pyridoxal phosphate-dependent enzyme [Agarilytica sp.]